MTGQESYDVVVVGGGGSGAPLAARLSEDAGRRVLLLEAGPAPVCAAGFPAELLEAGTIRGADPAHPQNWAFDSHLTPTRPYSVARGRILGGSTTTNGGYFVRARRADLDDWAASGNEQWGWAECLPFWRALESDEQFGPDALHGDSGPMPVSRVLPGHPVTAAFSAASAQAGFRAEPDKNGDETEGHGPLPMNVRDGVRWNTGLAYLLPALGRPNLEVRGGSTVRRVLFTGTLAVGVEFADQAGAVHAVRAREVVLAAGAVLSPQLLLVSGVGPRAELERLGIEVVADSPGVGAGFSDHPQVQLAWRPRPGVPLGAAEGRAMESALNATVALDDPGGRGLLAPPAHGRSDRGEHAGRPHPHAVGRGGELLAEVEVLPMLKPMGTLLSGRDEPGAPLVFLVAVQNPGSRGRIRLTSADPAARPAIDYDYLASPADRARMRAAVRLAARVAEAPAFAEVSTGLELDAAVRADDDALDAWVAATLGTALHLSGSARMGPDDDPGAVVDQWGRVRGVSGLRVADTSILPAVPRRGPAATAVLVGERIAAFLRAE